MPGETKIQINSIFPALARLAISGVGIFLISIGSILLDTMQLGEAVYRVNPQSFQDNWYFPEEKVSIVLASETWGVNIR